MPTAINSNYSPYTGKLMMRIKKKRIKKKRKKA